MEPNYTIPNSTATNSRLELVSNNDGLDQSFQSQKSYNSSNDSFMEYSQQYLMTKHSGNFRYRPSSKRSRRRLVYKNGEMNIAHANIKKRRQRFLADIFTTLVDIKWRWNLLIFTMGFIVSWLIFAFIWWLICFSHQDFQNFGRPDWKPCVANVKDFTTALLFSIETQHTIGYGFRFTTPNCPEAILVMMLQSCCGVIIQALMTGLVFAKLSRPKKRAETLMFSKNAVICKRNGELSLMFRVGDMRKSHIVEAHIRVMMITKKLTKEGEIIPLYQEELELDLPDGKLFLVWPIIVEHKIDANSPFWDISAIDLHSQQFELIAVLEGIVESTGMTTQARTSYLPEEVLWGHRFERLVTYQRENGEYQINYARFHATVPQDVPQHSAKELAELASTVSSNDKLNVHHEIDEDEDTETISYRSHSPVEGRIMANGEAQTYESNHKHNSDRDVIINM
ncbi:unnamed protein product [Owenia fusiformis]|uniref:Uncharacterized protein n=1 Tax=Owenia fusiformis TaxID=6347 RepID=A0A8J1UN05_OWEFU|nr:unnamed protein product [Owenia fusiformis]